jgi:L-fuconolactonase
MTIDAHVHFWKYNKKRDAWITGDMKVLQQDYLPEHLELNLKRNGIDGCIAVQADQSEVETRFLAELSRTHDIIKGVVGWIDLSAANVVERLEHFTQYPVIRGYRHIVQSEPAGFLLTENLHRGIAALKKYDYTYDILVYQNQLPDVLQFVERFPDQKLIIDHCAKPDIKGKEMKEWRNLMKEIAQQGHIRCKVSGLFTESAWKGWTVGEFYPYLDAVFEYFGIDRLIFGSDWPVILLSGMYVQWKSLLENYMQDYSAEDKEKFFGLNAVQFYNL